jgi:hypothetical protein
MAERAAQELLLNEFVTTYGARAKEFIDQYNANALAERVVLLAECTDGAIRPDMKLVAFSEARIVAELVVADEIWAPFLLHQHRTLDPTSQLCIGLRFPNGAVRSHVVQINQRRSQ